MSIRYYTYYIILGIIPSSIIQHDPHDPHDAASMIGAVPPQAAQPTPSRVARTGIRDTLVRTAQRARRPAPHRLPPVSRLLRRPPAHLLLPPLPGPHMSLSGSGGSGGSSIRGAL